ncbi:MAG: HAMP domain-containing histidine kinase, partial [Bacteroidia bacterium]|nr:HAMP domain-containing histidine kinase [Bacteroidia bacterium]
LRQQVEQVLSMTALERGDVPIQKTETDLHQIIRDSLKCMSVQIENVKGELDVSLDAEQMVVLGDRSHLTNSVCNLLDNAIKYSSGSPELKIRTYNEGSFLVLEVADKGIGIEEEYQTRIFEKFYRVPTGDIHDVKGFGLGLTYIKKIIEMHGGFVSLRSKRSEGTTVIINIPYA